LKYLHPLRTFRLLTAACAVTAPVVVPAGVFVAVGSYVTCACAQQEGSPSALPPAFLPPTSGVPATGIPVAAPQGANSSSTTEAGKDSKRSRAAAALLKTGGGETTPPKASGALTPEQARDEASGLAAQAKAALQRGDVATAKTLIDRAASLQIADNQFLPGQIKPWDVAMDVERALRLRTPSGVTTAAATSGTAASGKATDAAVQPGVFQPSKDSSKVAPASSSISPLLQENELSGQEWYDRGVESLRLGDRDAASGYFSKAWKKQAELDPATRAQLKDKLLYLQSRPEPEAVSAVPNESRESVQKKQRLFAEVSGEIADAERMVNDQPYEAIDRLKSLRTRVSQAEVDGAYRKQMLSMVDRVITNVEAWMEQNRSSIELDQRNRQIEDRITLDAANTAKEDAQIQTLVDQYNELMDDNRYAEAEVIARKVEEIKPNSEIASVMRGRSVIQRRIEEQKEIQKLKEEALLNSFSDAERSSATYLKDNQPLQFPAVKDWTDLRRLRDKYGNESLALQPSEKRILEILEEPFSASFDRRPLSEALKTISEMTGLIILIDEPSIAEEGLRSDQPISLDLRGNQIKLKNVLKNILEPLNLSYSIKNEVVKVQSRRFMQQEMYSKPYPIKDLVIPVPNFISDYNTGMAGAVEAAYQAQTNYVAVNLPEQDGMSLRSNKLASIDPNSNVLAQFASNSSVNPGSFSPGRTSPGMDPFPASGTAGGLGGASMANFSELMNLIQQTIAPSEWQDAGGTSTMMPFTQNLSLIVNAPQETHEQIADLLKSLRALQNLQVSIELRFIQLQDTFFEQIGVDFDANYDDKVRRIPQEDSGPSVVVGLSGQTSTVPALTGDFDIQLRQGSFGLPSPFGNPSATAGSQVGFAILSDLELFFFLQAAQGNSRQNVLQAPKVTMFDGQFGTINDFAQRPFVIGFEPVVGDFAVAQRPVIVILNEGTQMNVQSVVSQDKRFVRMTLMPQFTRLEATDRQFTFQGKKSTKSGTSILDPNGKPTGNRNNEEEIIEGTTVQQPTVGTTSVGTTVSVPDGGTILMGGIKRLQEGRTERGTPMLSKIPYINRLFRNTSIGRQTSTLMFTVTPRIIIPEEEEEELGIPRTRP